MRVQGRIPQYVYTTLMNTLIWTEERQERQKNRRNEVEPRLDEQRREATSKSTQKGCNGSSKPTDEREEKEEIAPANPEIQEKLHWWLRHTKQQKWPTFDGTKEGQTFGDFQAEFERRFRSYQEAQGMSGQDQLTVLTGLLKGTPREAMQNLEEAMLTSYTKACKVLTDVYGGARNEKTGKEKPNRISEDKTAEPEGSGQVTERERHAIYGPPPDRWTIQTLQWWIHHVKKQRWPKFNGTKQGQTFKKFKDEFERRLNEKTEIRGISGQDQLTLLTCLLEGKPREVMQDLEEEAMTTYAKACKTLTGIFDGTEDRNRKSEAPSTEGGPEGRSTHTEEEGCQQQREGNENYDTNKTGQKDINGRHFFMISIEGYETGAQADPGSIISLIAEDTLDRILKHTHKEHYRMFATREEENLNVTCGRTGITKDIKGLTMLPIRYNGIERDMAIYVVKGRGVYGLTLGQTFIMTHKVRIKKEDGTAAEATTEEAHYVAHEISKHKGETENETKGTRSEEET
jgi:hypothetical protein